jgi:hypothetical protein
MGGERPQSMGELVAAINGEWNELWAVVNRLTVEQLNAPDEGGWSPRDNLAHLTVWMKILMGHYIDGKPADAVLGVPIEITRDWDADVINRAMFERSRDRSLDDVTQELKQVYAELIDKLSSVPFDQLLMPRFADEPERGPLLDWVLGNTTEHFAEHRAVIEKAP